MGLISRYGSDIYIKLPALEKLNAMFLEILDSSQNREFWYVDEGNQSPSSNISSLFRRLIHRNDEKRWLPIPCVPDYGLHEKSRKELHKKHECTNQIHKAAMAINSSILAEMVVPESYLATLPKVSNMITSSTSLAFIDHNVVNAELNLKLSEWEDEHREPQYITTCQTPYKFSPEYLQDCLDITSEHEALELADRVEAAMYAWQRKAASMNSPKSSWDMVKDLMADGDKNVTPQAEPSQLLCFKKGYSRACHRPH